VLHVGGWFGTETHPLGWGGAGGGVYKGERGTICASIVSLERKGGQSSMGEGAIHWHPEEMVKVFRENGPSVTVGDEFIARTSDIPYGITKKGHQGDAFETH
jgi:hypothetical protein